MNRTSKTPANFGCPKGGGKKVNFCTKRPVLYHFQNFRYETMKSPLLIKL